MPLPLPIPPPLLLDPHPLPSSPQSLSNRRYINTQLPRHLRSIRRDTWVAHYNRLNDGHFFGLLSFALLLFHLLLVFPVYLPGEKQKQNHHYLHSNLSWSAFRVTQIETMPLKNLCSSRKDQAANNIPLIKE